MTSEQVLTAFFSACSLVCWINIRAIWIDKVVSGVSVWPTWIFLATNLYEVRYFTGLEQWWAVTGSGGMALANAVWLALVYGNRMLALADKRIAIWLDFQGYSH